MQGYETVKQTINESTPQQWAIQLNPLPQEGFVQYVGKYPVTVLLAGKPLKGDPVSLPAGTHKLTFLSTKKAYIRLTRTVEVKPGETITVRGPEMGSLTIKANPSNCKIFLNGEFIDYPPIFNLPVQAGNHTLLFNWEKTGKKQTRPIVVLADTNENVTAVQE
jgi:hypothetical protein